jgi:hypothetical protein
MNWFAFRYYWFVWLFFLTSTAILLYFILTHKDKVSCDSTRIEKSIEIINKQLDSCCSCRSAERVNNENYSEGQTPCNTKLESGGQGRTETSIELGQSSGTIDLDFNPKNQPDKLEVFYEGQRIASSHECPNNQNGMVGRNIGSGPCIISFEYRYRNDSFIKVVVTAPENETVWEYVVSCPK